MSEVVKYSVLYKWRAWGARRGRPLSQVSLDSQSKVLPSLPHVPIPTQGRAVPDLADA